MSIQLIKIPLPPVCIKLIFTGHHEQGLRGKSKKSACGRYEGTVYEIVIQNPCSVTAKLHSVSSISEFSSCTTFYLCACPDCRNLSIDLELQPDKILETVLFSVSVPTRCVLGMFHINDRISSPHKIHFFC